MTDVREVIEKVKRYQGWTTLKSLSFLDERLKFHKTMEEVLELLHDLETVETLVLRLTKVIETSSQVITCKDCKHCYVDGENVRYNVCELDHNKVQSDDWFCADGERKDEQ